MVKIYFPSYSNTSTVSTKLKKYKLYRLSYSRKLTFLFDVCKVDYNLINVSFDLCSLSILNIAILVSLSCEIEFLK